MRKNMAKFAKTPTTANTVLSDINELLCGYFLNGKKWFDPAAEKQHDMRMGQVTAEQYADCSGKAQVMAEEFVGWAKSNKYSGKVKVVKWTARPGSMSEAVGYEVDQRKNPTDILAQFTSGPGNGFLGLSAKATKGSGDIGFKNPGLGTIEKSLNLKLKHIVDKDMDFIVKSFKLPTNISARKAAIRKNAKVKFTTEELGKKTLSKLRDELFKKLSKMTQKELFTYIVNDWMDATESQPKYIKVTGQGNSAPYKAKVDDPTKNEKLDALNKGPIKLEANGISSVVVTAGSKKIMKMRFKWESQPLASSMKASGDPAS